MSRLSISLFVLLSILISSFALAQTSTVTTTTRTIEPSNPNVVVERREIVTTVPAAKETIAIPAGYKYCFTVEAGWVNDVWVPKRRVCSYENQPGRVAWVEGYWACTTYRSDDGTCTNWEWRPGHWSSSLTVY